MDTIYDVYLEKTIYSFVVHCSHLAWLQLFDAMDLQYDLGENSASIRKCWAGDKELKPPPIDSLCFKNVEIRSQLRNCSFFKRNEESVN
ncbi:hypothetical protein KPH14_011785 [Odynerus spinipes]|uniref:Uncharacterized protein n=1 Tax=Odynerus spinipes TaxID=1348599 RepID=A0AAD9VTU0_9HYME|nr:hypothetical protein KPH14_011785 [Odynerus spinipes]